MMMRRLAGCVLAVVGLAVAATPALADELLATTPRPTPVSAFGGRVAWSSYDPATRQYTLMTSAVGATAAVPVRPRSVPFDVDLGPDDRTLRIVAVYSRCHRDPPLRRHAAIGNVIAQMPDWARGRGCNIYKFDFETGRETKVVSTDSPQASEFLPSIWKGRIAFARVRERRRGPERVRPYLYLRRGQARSRRVSNGLRSTQRSCSGKPRRCRLLVEPGPTALDLRGTRLTFAWDSGGPNSAVYLELIGRNRVSRRRLVLGSSGSTQVEQMISPTINAGYVFWGFIRFGHDTVNQLLRHKGSTGRTEEAPLPLQAPGDAYQQSILAIALDDPDVFYLTSGLTTPGEPCTPESPCQPDPGCADEGRCKIWRTSTRNLAFRPFTRP